MTTKVGKKSQILAKIANVSYLTELSSKAALKNDKCLTAYRNEVQKHNRLLLNHDYNDVNQAAFNILNYDFNVNLPDICEDDFKGIKITTLAVNGIPSKPLSVKSSDTITKYRYNLSGEPIQEDHLTDAKAIEDGYVSISILDYDLVNNNLSENFKKFL